jgi:hypothetical protein
MGQSREKLRIFENVMGRVGLGGDFLGEYFKALSTVNGMQTMTEMKPPAPPMMPDQGQNVTTQPPITPNGTTMPPLGDQGLNQPT